MREKRKKRKKEKKRKKPGVELFTCTQSRGEHQPQVYSKNVKRKKG